MLTPLATRNWDAAKAAHLLNRAGFGNTPEEVDRLARLTPEQAVAALLDFDGAADQVPPPAWVKSGADERPHLNRIKDLPESERRVRMAALRQEQKAQMEELRAWWLRRMLETPHPLQEKLTLFWHGHFASSIRKVRSAYAMYRQNETFRRLAAGNYRSLVMEASREPAMLIYLDNAQSRAQAPNENFARELMELFTLGEGHYTEKDVQEAARALTGWSLERERFAFLFRPRAHDDGIKEFLGKRGAFDGGDIVDIILSQPRAADFIGAKLWEFFAYEDPGDSLVRDLGACLRDQHYELRPALAALFGSAEFYSDQALRTQIKSPVQWLIGSLKVCAIDEPPARQAARALSRLGQDLFDPPNVKGWEGGFAWIDAASLIDRYNFAGALVAGGKGGPARNHGLSGARVLPAAQRASREQAQAYLQRRVFMGPVRPEDARAVQASLASLPEPQAWSDGQVRELVRLMMSTPDYQLT